MSHPENTDITDAIARNVGIRWCSTCNADRPAAGFIKRGPRWICAGCQKRRANGTPLPWITKARTK